MRHMISMDDQAIECYDRSYLFGCLLAIAEFAEASTFSDPEKRTRQTSAKRFWNMFFKHPSTTWKKIYEDLVQKMVPRDYDAIINMVMERFSDEDFLDDAPLDPSYLMAYNRFMAKLQCQ